MHGIKTVPVEPTVRRYGVCLPVASRRNKNIEVAGSLISVEMSSYATPDTKRADSSYLVNETESCLIIAKSYMNISNTTGVLGNPVPMAVPIVLSFQPSEKELRLFTSSVLPVFGLLGFLEVKQRVFKLCSWCWDENGIGWVLR